MCIYIRHDLFKFQTVIHLGGQIALVIVRKELGPTMSKNKTKHSLQGVYLWMEGCGLENEIPH